MKEFIDKLIDRLEEETIKNKEVVKLLNEQGFKFISIKKAIEIVNELAEEYKGGWIPCERELPPQPKENPLFENKPLELYLVSLNSTDYPWRAFWNGKFFTDGWSKIEPIAWMPLPAPYTEGE